MMKNNKFCEVGCITLFLFVVSFLLNFVWESFHSVFLYQGHNFNAIKYVPMIGYVSIVDGLLVVGMYLIVSLLLKDIFWIRTPNKNKVVMFMVIGLIIAWFIEYRAVFIQSKWSYTALMPVIFGIGISPLLQLSITGIASLILTKMLFYQKGVFYGR